jgi:hypothetical protein
MTAITTRTARINRLLAACFAAVFAGTAALAYFGPAGWPAGVALLAFLLNLIAAGAWFAVQSWRADHAYQAERQRRYDASLDGRNVLRAFVYGDDIPAMEAAAMAKARELWGETAAFHVDRVDNLGTSFSRDKGAFLADVYVLRTDDGAA